MIKDTSVVPPETWSYTVPETNTTFSVYNYHTLYPLIVTHCENNNISVPDEQTVVNTLCKNLTIECFDADALKPLINKFTLGVPRPMRVGCCGKRK